MEQKSHLPFFRALSLTATMALLAGYFLAADGKLFSVLDPETKEACVLVEVNFTLTLTAIQDGDSVADAELTSEDEEIQVIGSCGDVSSSINLFFPTGANWAFIFEQMGKTHDVVLTKLIQFVPIKVFDNKVNSTDYQSMEYPGHTDLYTSDYSYECTDSQVAEYLPVTVTTPDTNYTAVANISYIRAQAFNIQNSTFSHAVHCNIGPPSTTSTAKPTSHSSGSTLIPPTHPSPSVNLYIVEENKIICIALKAALKIDIKYPLKDQPGKTKTAKFIIPKDATASGNCSLSTTSQLLEITFFKNWELSFVFSSAKKNLRSSSREDNSTHSSYRISKIEVIAYADEERFPGSNFSKGQKLTFLDEEPNAIHVSDTQGYYKCENSLDTKVNDNLTLQSKEMELKAFNSDNEADFTGPPAECVADNPDDHSKRTTYIIVGCVIAGIVLLCLIVFIVMRVLRKRRSGYENVQ